MASAPKKIQKDALELWVEAARANPERAVAMMLWANRIRVPDMFVRVDAQLIKGYEDCMQYLKVKPRVVIHREQAIPASPAQPAAGNRRAIPARPEIPAKEYAVITLVEEGKDGKPTMNGIVPVENNQADYDAAQEAARIRAARDKAQGLADALLAAAQTGNYSSTDLRDASEALVLLARAA